jgi:uncharacterized protein (TIGR04255 family)
MAQIREFLRNAPIREAVIDLRVRERRDFELSDLDGIQSHLERGYVKRGPVVELLTNLSISGDGEGKAETSSRTLGIRLHSRDERYVAQFSREGFTFSRLAPYETWDKLIAEARRLWTIYAACAQPQIVTRVAARFINDLQLPMQPGEQFEGYLTAPPQVPSGLPQQVLQFLQRVVIHDVNSGLRAIVTQMLQGAAWGERIPVILDIDVFCQTEIEPASDDIWTRLAKMRVFKNSIFFESLTDKTVELYA